MTLDITVRGSAEQHHPAERAVVTLAAAIEGSDKQVVFADAVAIQEPLTGQLKDMVGQGAVHTWSSDQVRVFSQRPWAGDGQRSDLLHTARLHVRAEFTDFEQLAAFLDHWSGVDGVEVGDVTWDVSVKHRASIEAAVRKAAVDNAVAKAQSYADAVRKGKVIAVQLADPGMLTAPSTVGGRSDAMPALYKDASGGSVLELTPEEIVIRVEVDARFTAS